MDFVGIYKQDSLLIIRHGKIVVDAYYAPYAPNIRHDLRSVTKSFISTLTGIEVQERFLDGVDDPIVDLFTDKHISNLDDTKKAITVQNMLDMTSGIAWSEDAYTPDETIIRMTNSGSHGVCAEPTDVRPAGRALLLQRRQSRPPVRVGHQDGRARRAAFHPTGCSSL